MRRTISLGLIALLALAAGDAFGIPAFARITGMGCPACHDSWPKLNDFGELFRDRGYRLRESDSGQQKDRPLEYAPFALRTTLAYQFEADTHQATDAGDQTVRRGAFLFPEADLLAGTTLSRHLSVLAVASGFGSDGAVSLESAWVRVNSLGSGWLNLKLGKLEVDLPASEHRTYTLTTPFLIYHFHPTGSTNGFSIGDNQLALEVSGHGEGPGFRYEVALASALDNPGSATALSSPAAYAHLTYTTLPASRALSRVRLGLLGDLGFVPTVFQTLTAGGDPAPVPGTGSALKPFLQAGADISATFGPLAAPLSVTAAWLYGQEDQAMIPGATRGARYAGGFVEVDYTPTLPLTLALRYDAVLPLAQPDPAQPAETDRQSAVTLASRYALFLSPWGSVAVHVELSSTNTQGAGATPGTPARSTLAVTGLDLAF